MCPKYIVPSTRTETLDGNVATIVLPLTARLACVTLAVEPEPRWLKYATDELAVPVVDEGTAVMPTRVYPDLATLNVNADKDAPDAVAETLLTFVADDSLNCTLVV